MTRPPSRVLKNKENIIKRVEAGTHLKDIADDMEITPAAISNQLADDKEYKVARVRGMEQRLDDREKELEQATTAVDMNKADKLLKLQQWKLERLCREVYGNQPALNIQINTIPTSELLTEDLTKLVKDIKK